MESFVSVHPLGVKVLGKILVGRDQTTDDPELVRLSAEDFDRLSIIFKSVGVEIGAHQRLGLFQLDVKPWGDIRERALRGGELLVAAIECLREAARDPALALPDIAAKDYEVLRREALVRRK